MLPSDVAANGCHRALLGRTRLLLSVEGACAAAAEYRHETLSVPWDRKWMMQSAVGRLVRVMKLTFCCLPAFYLTAPKAL